MAKELRASAQRVQDILTTPRLIPAANPYYDDTLG